VGRRRKMESLIETVVLVPEISAKRIRLGAFCGFINTANKTIKIVCKEIPFDGCCAGLLR
jgi:hypothetical protein